MRRREMLAGATASATVGAARAKRPPNFIIVLCDDLGYGDVSGVYGPALIKTPQIEKMAREGTVLTDYYAPANLCSPSRAGLLTGRYAVRAGLGYEVIMADDDRGLPLSEITIGKALKPAGYATALYGKWHLGHRGPAWPPTNHGFDHYFGIPYSHDMNPLALFESQAGSGAVKQSPVVYERLQQDFYSAAERFIEQHKARPFFVELALSAPHLPEHPHPKFDVGSVAGPYGAVVMEIDSIVGRLLAKLRALKLENDTIVVFTSDNGPWFEGSAGPLRERKGGPGYDGGYRVPCIVWGPGRVPAGKRTDAIAMGIDFLPTFVALAGLPQPDVHLDGKDISNLLLHGGPTPHDQLVLFDNETPMAIRTQDWKYVGGTVYRGARIPYSILGYEELYRVSVDKAESYSVASTHPDVAKTMKSRLEKAIAEFAPLKHKEPPLAIKKMHEALSHFQD